MLLRSCSGLIGKERRLEGRQICEIHRTTGVVEIAVADIAVTVTISVYLSRVGHVGAVIGEVTDAISIGIGSRRSRRARHTDRSRTYLSHPSCRLTASR